MKTPVWPVTCPLVTDQSFWKQMEALHGSTIARKFTRLSTIWTSVMIKFRSFTADKTNLLTLLLDKPILMPWLKTVLIASRTCFNSTWIRKILGTLSHLVQCIKTSLPFLDLRILALSLLTHLMDHRMRACTLVTSLKDFGIASLSMPLRERHLKSPHKISWSTPPLRKEQTVLTIVPHEPSSLWISWFRLGILKINFWTHLGLSFMYLSIAELISRSFCSSSL